MSIKILSSREYLERRKHYAGLSRPMIKLWSLSIWKLAKESSNSGTKRNTMGISRASCILREEEG